MGRFTWIKLITRPSCRSLRSLGFSAYGAAPHMAGVTRLVPFEKSKIGNRENGNIGAMLKAIITISGKFNCIGTQLNEIVFAGAKLTDNSFQHWWSFCFVRSVKPKFQSTIAPSRANQKFRPSFHALPSVNGFVNLLASIYESGRVTSGSTGHKTAARFCSLPAVGASYPRRYIR